MPDPAHPQSPPPPLVAVVDAYLAVASARGALDHAGHVGAATVQAARPHRGVARAAARAQERVQRAGGALREADERWLTLLRVYADELGVRGPALIDLVEGRRLAESTRTIGAGLEALRQSLALVPPRPGPLPAAVEAAAAALERLLAAARATPAPAAGISPPASLPPPPPTGAGTPPRR